MATNFPASLDTLTNPTSSDSLSSPSHSAQHANVNDAVEALQAKVGADSSAVTSSHDYKISDHASRLTTLEGRDLAGLVPLASSTFSAVASVSVDNCFSSTYANYLITYRQTNVSAAAAVLSMRLRVGGAESTGVHYTTHRLIGYSSTVSTSNNPTGAQTWYIANTGNSYPTYGMFTMMMFAPAETKTTVARLDGQNHDGNFVVYANAYTHSATTAYDGFTFYVSSGNISGTLNVYGMVNP